MQQCLLFFNSDYMVSHPTHLTRGHLTWTPLCPSLMSFSPKTGSLSAASSSVTDRPEWYIQTPKAIHSTSVSSSSTPSTRTTQDGSLLTGPHSGFSLPSVTYSTPIFHSQKMKGKKVRRTLLFQDNSKTFACMCQGSSRRLSLNTIDHVYHLVSTDLLLDTWVEWYASGTMIPDIPSRIHSPNKHRTEFYKLNLERRVHHLPFSVRLGRPHVDVPFP